MKVCSICHRQYSDSLKFCLEDGTVLTATAQSDATLVDPQATLRLNARETAPAMPPKQTRTVGWIALGTIGIVVVIAIVAVAAIVMLNSSSKPSSTSDVTNASKPAEISRAASTLSVEQEVERINSEVGTTMVKGDPDALARMLADDYRYVSDVGLTLNKLEVLMLIRTGNLSYEYLTTTDPKVVVNSDSTKADLTAQAQAKGQMRRQSFTDSYFYRNSYEKRDGRWQLVSGTVWHRR